MHGQRRPARVHSYAMAQDSDDKLDRTGEFFVVGSPLHAVRAGYVRRRADDLLYEAAVGGRYAHVIAPDRSGKSSLIASTAARLEAHGVRVAILDLGQIGDREGGQDAGRWYYNVAYRLLRQLRIRIDLQTWWQDKSILSNRQRLVEFYSEILLANVDKRIVILVDEVQSIEELPFADELLGSIRSAHTARATDPEFSRLTFVLLGECDPLSLVNEPELSPFNVTQSIPLDDFSRADLDLFASELNLDRDSARVALDRVYYWTGGQPYLTQKLARGLARETRDGDIEEHVDRIVMQQLAGKAALHSEPLMSHIHRQIVGSGKQSEKLLNLYGKIRKGVVVPADLGSPLQRRLMAVGLLQIDEAGELKVRNRIYATVFTARWANENLPAQWRAPTAAMLLLAVVALVPLWYTQWLPKPYARVLTSAETELPVAEAAWFNLRSFPMHAGGADNLYRQFLIQRARDAVDRDEILAIAVMAETLPGAGSMPEQFRAEFWDRRVHAALRLEQRDAALIASLQSLVLATPARRNRSAMLVGDDYPALLASVTPRDSERIMLNPDTLQVTATSGSTVSQWTVGAQGATRIEDWSMTALEVSPLVRRIIVGAEGIANRVGLTLSISHSRFRDLRIKVIAPSGRAVELDLGLERASVIDRIVIPASQLEPLVGEALSGTWSISIRDEATGIAGYLDGWTLTLNAQVLVEDFQRGIGIPDPVEREAARFWTSKDSRYAVARATQSDSARLWDLAFGRPLATLAITGNETLIGVDGSGRYLVTATPDHINLWDITSGKRAATLPSGPGSDRATLTDDGRHLVVQNRSDAETAIEWWRIDAGEKVGQLNIAGVPALVAYDAEGRRVAVADYDRAARLWDLESGELIAQFDLPYQPSDLRLSAAGDTLAAVFGRSGVSLWSVADPDLPLLEHVDEGDWRLRFSPSGARVVIGRPESGYDVHASDDGRRLGPTVGAVGTDAGDPLLAFSLSEDVLATRGPGNSLRFWQLPVVTSKALPQTAVHPILSTATDAVVAAIPGAQALLVGDRDGHVHRLPTDSIGEALTAARDDVSFLGHNAPVRSLEVSPDGAFVASVAADSTLRVWSAVDGLPKPYVINLPAIAGRLAFAPDNSRLAMLSGNRLIVVNLENGEVDADVELGEPHADLAFGANATLYLGSGSGALNVVSLGAPGAWTVRRLWQGEAAIRLLELSPRERFLVVVDSNRLARQFEVADGRMGERSLQLPSPVEEISFSPNGARVLFRTARWAHRVGSSTAGLIWLQAHLIPRPLAAARIVYDDTAASGQTFYVPTARDGLITLAPQRFDDSVSQGLFGKRQDLLSDWGRRLDAPIFATDAR